MSYRIEIASQGRAGCQAPPCKKENVKIQKGELRQGVMVEVNGHQGWKWRHWSCITPAVLHNWWENAGEDLDLIDGLDDLPDDCQEKVKRCLQQGHIDDEDYAGDVEVNRWNGKKSQGMFMTAKEKEAKEKEAESGDDGEKKPAGKKRGRPAKAATTDEDDEPAKPAKKARGKKAAVESEAEVPAKPAVQKGSGKKAANADDAAPAKKGRGRPRKSLGLDGAADEEDEEVEAAPKKARGRPRKSVATDVEEEVEPAPKKARGRPRKSITADEDVDEVSAEVEAAPAKKGRGRPKKMQSEPSPEAVDEAPKRGRGRPRKSLPTEDEE